eukprot:CAMPEP_0171238366 /NCGR_PEP_ID=MMETSP0790-20130122/43437_1 /TAXON_ID=2925 /ORGANISM="Alexandrium catenella, Strain OF101" /LENGTH=240 /DNA_ID=CAMNT_0011704731 /DNA_START=61 /DNA_END=783 /DNA_ORIENTATION=-
MSLRQVGRMAAVASLLSAAAALRQRQEEDFRPNCACMNWKEVYANGLAQCGDGMELYSVDYNVSKDVEGLCTDVPGMANSSFFKTQDHEMCIQADMTKSPAKKRYGYSWCYVSRSCSEIGHGQKTASLKWKTCTQKDKLMSGLEPGDLFDMSSRQGSNNILMAKMSYEFPQVKGLVQFTKGSDPIHNWIQSAAREHLGLAPVDSGKQALRKMPMDNTLKYNGQIWEVYANKAVCVEGCPI